MNTTENENSLTNRADKYIFTIEIEREGNRREKHHLTEFPYASLPIELRRMVCDEYFLSTHDLRLYPAHTFFGEWSGIFDRHRKTSVEFKWKTRPHFTALLATSRQVYDEAVHSYRKYFLSSNTPSIHRSSFYRCFPLLSEPVLERLKSVAICLEHGTIDHAMDQDDPEGYIVEKWQLKKMPNLRELKIGMCRRCNSWATIPCFRPNAEKLLTLLKDAGMGPTEIKNWEYDPLYTTPPNHAWEY